MHSTEKRPPKKYIQKTVSQNTHSENYLPKHAFKLPPKTYIQKTASQNKHSETSSENMHSENWPPKHTFRTNCFPIHAFRKLPPKTFPPKTYIQKIASQNWYIQKTASQKIILQNYPQIIHSANRFPKHTFRKLPPKTYVYRVRATSWSPWKALEFNFRFQGRLKSPEEFLLKVLENNENSLNFCSDGR